METDTPTNEAVGTYCEYVQGPNNGPEKYNTFEAYKDTLTLDCPSFRTSGRLEWTPDRETPDLVYYHVRIPLDAYS